MDQIQYTWPGPLSEEMRVFENDVTLRLGFGGRRPVQLTAAFHRKPVPVANSNKGVPHPQMLLRRPITIRTSTPKSFVRVSSLIVPEAAPRFVCCRMYDC